MTEIGEFFKKKKKLQKINCCLMIFSCLFFHVSQHYAFVARASTDKVEQAHLWH